MVHRRLFYIYLLNVPCFSSRYFNKIKLKPRLGRLLALSLEILCYVRCSILLSVSYRPKAKYLKLSDKNTSGGIEDALRATSNIQEAQTRVSDVFILCINPGPAVLVNSNALRKGDSNEMYSCNFCC